MVAIFGDTLDDGDVSRLRRDLLAFWQAERRDTPLKLALVLGRDMDLEGPFATRAALESTLSKLARSEGGTAAPLEPMPFYLWLGSVAPQFGSDWSTVVLAGRFPPTEPVLANYGTAWLEMQFRSARLRLSWWDLASHEAGLRKPESESFIEVSAQTSQSRAGAGICPVVLVDAAGQNILTALSIAAAGDGSLPDPVKFVVLKESNRLLSVLVRNPQLSPEQTEQAEASVESALAIGPRDDDTLRLARKFYERTGNDRKLSATLAVLTDLAPDEPGLFVSYGHCLFRLQDWEQADRILLRAAELAPADPKVSEELARIRINRGDERAALLFLEKTLAADSRRQDLWLLRADLATRIGDWNRTADSLERAIALGAVPLARRTSLIEIYLEHENSGRALFHARAAASALPPDKAVRSQYAVFFERLKLPDEALAAWKRTLDTDPSDETAHVRIARILIDGANLPAALEAANAGLERLPHSSRLFLVKAEALEKTDHYYEARRVLRDSETGAPDPALLEYLARLEDAGGEHAASRYRSAVEALDKAGKVDKEGPASGGESIDRNAAIEHGLAAALRDNDPANVQWFEAQRRTKDSKDAQPTPAVSLPGTKEIPIPGGIAALSFIARAKPSTPETFLIEFARTSIANLRGQTGGKEFTAAVRDHLRRVNALMTHGKPLPEGVRIAISAQNKASRQQAETILGLLGWRMRIDRNQVRLETVEKGELARNHETAAALALDEVGMQKALESGKEFSFTIPVDNVAVRPREEMWKPPFYPRAQANLVEALAGDVALAEAYAATAPMNRATVTALFQTVSPLTVAEKYGQIMLEFGSSLTVEQGKVNTPGGERAYPIWTNLAGASPAQPPAFLQALLAKDDGRLLAFYAELSDLDIAHQKFFTASLARTTKYYQLFSDSSSVQRTSIGRINVGSFAEFLNEVPLDSEGHVDFPGSPEVWLVAKGQSRDVSHLARKLKRTAAPDVEDHILVRLAKTGYNRSALAHSELENFLAVARIDAHRSDPLEDASALLLAQHYAEDAAIYPWFAAFPALKTADFEHFFALAEILRSRPPAERGREIAGMESLIEIVAMAAQSGSLKQEDAAAWFAKIVARMGQANTPALRTVACIDLMQDLLGKSAADRPDEALMRLLLPAVQPVDVPLNGSLVSLDPGKTREDSYRKVLDLQKAPSLATIFAISDALRNLSAGKGDASRWIQVLETKSAGLNFVEVPKEAKLQGKDREFFEGFRPRRLADITKDLREKTSRKRVNPKDVQGLAADYMEEIEAPVRWALLGVVYARFLRPADLLVSEDPLLLRKHTFREPYGIVKAPLFSRAELRQSNEKAGSYFSGSLADFGDAAGMAAAKSARLGGGDGETFASKQLTAIVATDWADVRDRDVRLFSLRMAVAREWIVHSAADPKLRSDLAESLLGLVSMNRRTDLLNGLDAGDWSAVWTSVTLSDIFSLSDRYLDRYKQDPWQSQATTQMRKELARAPEGSLDWLGGSFSDTFGCSHPHLFVSLPPYESFEQRRSIAPGAERVAEFKFYLAESAGKLGLPASAMGLVAEPAATGILKRLKVSDNRDWRSVLNAYASFDTKALEGVLAAQ